MQNLSVVFQLNIRNNIGICASIARPNTKPRNVKRYFRFNYTSMNKYKETFETWNSIASVYEEKFMDLDLYNETYNVICESSTRPNAKVLEIGCGPGNITRYLLSQRPDFDILGTDISPNMIELARKNNPLSTFQVMDARDISQLESRFDLIVCGFCLPYLSIAESQKLIDDASKMLNPESSLYLSFVEGNPENSGFKTSSAGRVYFQYHHPDTIINNLKSAGFSDILTFNVKYRRSETESEDHSIIIARKKNI